jgi:Zn-dependent metalloprotease
MKHNYCKLLLLVVLTATCQFAFAQKDTLEIQRDKKGNVQFARFARSANASFRMNNTVNFLGSILKSKPNDELRPEKEWKDELGMTHKKFRQYYKGIRVEQGEYLVHGKGEQIEYINGSFEPVSLSSIKPGLPEKQALNKALGFVKAVKYKWEDESSEAFIRQHTGNAQSTYYPKGELVICKNYLQGGNELKLAWRFTVYALLPESGQVLFVDAATGEIINSESLIHNGNVAGTAQTMYSGTQNIIGDSFSGGFRLRESRNSVNVQTLNMNGGSAYIFATDFVDNDNSWTAAEHANANLDQAALDAHWASEIILDYWRTVHNRNSINGSGMTVKSYIHYIPSGETVYNNASWDGSVMRYGDGNGTFLSPFTTLDISAHEFGHGVCQYTSNLAYNAHESGALNEGFSDIWGATIEAWAAPGKQRWVIGEDMFFGIGLRSMSNPDVNTLYGTNWSYSTATDVYTHTNLGVLDHWYFLLSDGGDGWNNGLTSHASANDGYHWSVQGIGLTDAAKIAYRTEQNLTSSAGYATTRNVSIQAARDLFGAGSCQEIAVTDAWYAVGVGAAYTVYTVLGDNTVCSTSGNYTVNNLPGGATVEWQAFLPA